MDEEIGFLPGTEQEKILPFMRPVFDNLEVLLDSDESERYKNEKDTIFLHASVIVYIKCWCSNSDNPNRRLLA